jgi:polysaccharide deacetylase family protein (PEP-CTERM system associated)
MPLATIRPNVRSAGLPAGIPNTASDAEVVNVMSVDVEDYFQVSAFDNIVDRATWEQHESRVSRNTETLLELFERFDVRATFFVLGWVAERHPQIVRRIAAAGHELASHGFGHRLVYDLTPDAFRDDLRRAKAAIESAAGAPVLGYRAPSFSITERSLWALDVLIEEGYAYDASIFPIRHDRYGIPDAPRMIHQIRRPGGSIWEVPGSTVRLAGTNLPASGGGYFRMLPYSWTQWAIRRINEVDRQPVVFYLHPWEIDPDQPRFAVPLPTRVRHYTGLDKSIARLTHMLATFRFAPVMTALETYALDDNALLGIPA